MDPVESKIRGHKSRKPLKSYLIRFSDRCFWEGRGLLVLNYSKIGEEDPDIDLAIDLPPLARKAVMYCNDDDGHGLHSSNSFFE